jgi:hypothetical protein
MANKTPCEIDGVTGEVTELSPQKTQRYRCKLDTMQDVKREMAKVYRESRSELIDPVTGTKLIWMLQSVARVIEVSDLEKRIEILESKK